MANKQLAQDFFTAHLPSNLPEQVDLETIKPESAHFIDEELNQNNSGLVFSVQLKNQKNAFSSLIQHRSGEDPLIACHLFYGVMPFLKRRTLYDKAST